MFVEKNPNEKISKEIEATLDGIGIDKNEELHGNEGNVVDSQKEVEKLKIIDEMTTENERKEGFGIIKKIKEKIKEKFKEVFGNNKKGKNNVEKETKDNER